MHLTINAKGLAYGNDIIHSTFDHSVLQLDVSPTTT